MLITQLIPVSIVTYRQVSYAFDQYTCFLFTQIHDLGLTSIWLSLAADLQKKTVKYDVPIYYLYLYYLCLFII